MSRSIVDRLGHSDEISHRELRKIDRCGRGKTSTRLAELGAADLKVDRSARTDHTHDVHGREPIGFDEIVVPKHLARGDRELSVANLVETNFFENAFDSFADQSVWVSVDRRE
jgi:hypothetical protein